MSFANRLNKRVTVLEKSVTRAANGEEIPDWVPFTSISSSGDGKVWAEVEPIRGEEFFSAAQMQGAVDYKVTIRYTPVIRKDMRIQFGSLILDIASEPINVKSASRRIELMCTSGVRNG